MNVALRGIVGFPADLDVSGRRRGKWRKVDGIGEAPSRNRLTATGMTRTVGLSIRKAKSSLPALIL